MLCAGAVAWDLQHFGAASSVCFASPSLLLCGVEDTSAPAASHVAVWQLGAAAVRLGQVAGHQPGPRTLCAVDDSTWCHVSHSGAVEFFATSCDAVDAAPVRTAAWQEIACVVGLGAGAVAAVTTEGELWVMHAHRDTRIATALPVPADQLLVASNGEPFGGEQCHCAMRDIPLLQWGCFCTRA